MDGMAILSDSDPVEILVRMAVAKRANELWAERDIRRTKNLAIEIRNEIGKMLK